LWRSSHQSHQASPGGWRSHSKKYGATSFSSFISPSGSVIAISRPRSRQMRRASAPVFGPSRFFRARVSGAMLFQIQAGQERSNTPPE
jgi:hypothetical protein